MPNLLPSGTTQADSIDIVVAIGSSATFALFGDGTAGSVPEECYALIQKKSSSGVYVTFGDAITTSEPLRVLRASGTFRIRKLASAIAFGVDQD